MKINPELRKAIMILLAEDPLLDQDKLIEKIKAKKMVGLTEAVIRVGVKVFMASKNSTEVKAVPNEVQPITIT